MESLVQESVAAVSGPDWLGTTAHKNLLFPTGLRPNPVRNINRLFLFQSQKLVKTSNVAIYHTPVVVSGASVAENKTSDSMRNIRSENVRAHWAVEALEDEMEDG